MQGGEGDRVARRRRGRRTLLLLALVCAAPVLASYVAYYWLRPEARTNYGELLEPATAPEISGTRPDGTAFRLADLHGRWTLLIVAGGAACDTSCQRGLYATRQAHTMQGGERNRISRVLLLPAGAPALAPELSAEHPGMTVAHGDPRQWTALLKPPGDKPNIYLVDPHGNFILRYPPNPDIRRLAKDLERLLRASRIG
ncbi:MAG TPA: cytochrome C oxidase subunit I [Casimicrobiaceae bacterium]|nr:cytochrome C oxidase subunit I [Casimicrobiaceae bacterium]